MLATRFAPSPAGKDIHLGNLRADILNWEYAKKGMLCDEDCLSKFPEAAFCRDVIREHMRCYGMWRNSPACGNVLSMFPARAL